jgi:hypothetical protein
MQKSSMRQVASSAYTLLKNVGLLPMDYTVLYLRQNSLKRYLLFHMGMKLRLLYDRSSLIMRKIIANEVQRIPQPKKS